MSLPSKVKQVSPKDPPAVQLPKGPCTRSATSKGTLLPTLDLSSPKDSLTNKDILSTLLSFRQEVLASNKASSETQLSQFENLKSSFERLSIQIDELKAENSNLRRNLDSLSNRVATLELNGPCDPASISAQVLHETFEREKCASNVLAYGVPESSSESPSQRITDDKCALERILLLFNCPIPQSIRLIRLGKLGQNGVRPLKIFCGSKEVALKLLNTFNEHKRSGSSIPLDFRIARDKTQLQRQQLKSCHQELDNRCANGENDLCIRFVNGLPKVQTKNGNSFQTRPPNRYHLQQRTVNQSPVSTKTVVV